MKCPFLSYYAALNASRNEFFTEMIAISILLSFLELLYILYLISIANLGKIRMEEYYISEEDLSPRPLDC